METPATSNLSHLGFSPHCHSLSPDLPQRSSSSPPRIHSLYGAQHQLVWRHTGSSLSHLSPLCLLVTSEKLKLLSLPAGLAPVCRFSWFAFPRTEVLSILKPIIHLKDRMWTGPEPCPRVTKLLLVKTRSPGDFPPYRWQTEIVVEVRLPLSE